MRTPGLLVLAVVLFSSAAANAQDNANCTLIDDRPSPYRVHGTAHVQIRGDGFSWNLPAQPAVCGAAAIETLHDFTTVKAGSGFYFQACVPEGVIEVFSNAPGPVPTSRSALFAQSSILFATIHTSHPQSYVLRKPEPGDQLTVDRSRRAAMLKGTLRVDRSDAKLDVEVSFDCSRAGPIPSAPIAESAPAPQPVPWVAPSRPLPRPKPSSSNCNMSYRIGETPRKNAVDVDSPQTCQAAAQLDALAQCRSHGVPSDLISGMFRFRSGADWSSQIFSTTCARREAGAPLCLSFPCLHELAKAPGCQPCTGGMSRDANCECVYPRGATYCQAFGRSSFSDQSSFPVDDSSFGACRARVERDVLRRCQADVRDSGETRWAELTIEFFNRGNDLRHSYLVDCRDVLAGKGLCSGEACPRPCPKGECLLNGECVVPGGPLQGTCRGPIFCEMCK